jgi:hypothetical protein
MANEEPTAAVGLHEVAIEIPHPTALIATDVRLANAGNEAAHAGSGRPVDTPVGGAQAALGASAPTNCAVATLCE